MSICLCSSSRNCQDIHTISLQLHCAPWLPCWVVWLFGSRDPKRPPKKFSAALIFDEEFIKGVDHIDYLRCGLIHQGRFRSALMRLGIGERCLDTLRLVIFFFHTNDDSEDALRTQWTDAGGCKSIKPSQEAHPFFSSFLCCSECSWVPD